MRFCNNRLNLNNEIYSCPLIVRHKYFSLYYLQIKLRIFSLLSYIYFFVTTLLAFDQDE